MMPDMAILEILERAVSAGVRIDTDGSRLFAHGAVPPSLAALIGSRRADLVALLTEQRRIRAADCDPATAWGRAS